MGILWRHIWARIKPRLSYADLETIFRSWAIAVAKNEPLSTYMSRLRERDGASDLISVIIGAVAARLHDISAKETKANQARECRVLLLEQIDRRVSDGYLAFGGDESLRHICLAAMYGAETDEDIRTRETEKLVSYCNALWIETSIAALYEEQFNSYMPLDNFWGSYIAMTAQYTRFLYVKLFSQVMSEQDRLDLRRVSELYEEACADSTVLELAEIRAKYCDAIKKGFVENLFPLQKRFASIAQSAISSVEAAFKSAGIEHDEH